MYSESPFGGPSRVEDREGGVDDGVPRERWVTLPTVRTEFPEPPEHDRQLRAARAEMFTPLGSYAR